MPPSVLIELNTGPSRRSRITRIGIRARQSGGTAVTGMHPVPRHVAVILTYPADVLADSAFHQVLSGLDSRSLIPIREVFETRRSPGVSEDYSPQGRAKFFEASRGRWMAGPFVIKGPRRWAWMMLKRRGPHPPQEIGDTRREHQ
jgi:hypothetical protein